MHKYKKLGLTLFLTAAMTVGSILNAFAAPEDYGPAYDPALNPAAQETPPDTTGELHPRDPDQDTEGQAPSTEATGSSQTGPGETAPSEETGAPDQEGTSTEGTSTGDGVTTEDGTSAGDGVTTEDGTSAGDGVNTEDGTSAGEETPPQEEEVPNILTVPLRAPRLQTTILLADAHQWSQAFVNDQWITVDGRPFYSISTFLENIHGNFLYRTYSASNGWSLWVMNGQQTNIPADFAPVEAIQCRFAGPVNNDYDIYYTTTLSNGEQTGWAKNGETCGTMNAGLYITGYRLAFFRKGDVPDVSFENTVVSAHPDGIQYIDGAMRYIHGDGSNFTGWGWIGNDRYYFVDSYPVTGWQYIDGYKYYFGEDGKLFTDIEPIIGTGGPFQIKINKQMDCLTVYTSDGANGFIVPVKSFLVSTGDDTPVGTFKTPEKYRWRLMINDVYTQYATRLGSGLSILMHSIIYDAPNPYTVWASTYNNLGIARSAGCIRLTTADSKWIYDNCPIGTTVTVYNSSIPGPFERPTIAYEIPFEQTWDPTDPNLTPEGIAAESARIIAAHPQ